MAVDMQVLVEKGGLKQGICLYWQDMYLRYDENFESMITNMHAFKSTEVTGLLSNE